MPGGTEASCDKYFFIQGNFHSCTCHRHGGCLSGGVDSHFAPGGYCEVQSQPRLFEAGLALHLCSSGLAADLRVRSKFELSA